MPVNTQPAVAAPLTVVDARAPVADSALATPLGTSTQTTAFGHEALTITSSGSPSAGSKDADGKKEKKKKKKKKKRKADGQAAGGEASPHAIKAEPHSQSPLIAPAYARPSKRQRQSQRRADEPGQSEPSQTQPPPNASHEQHPPQARRNELAPAAYQYPDAARHLPLSASSSTLVGEPAAEPNYSRDFDDRRVSGEGYFRPPPPGEGYARRELPRGVASYHHPLPPPREIRDTGASPQVIAYDPYREPVRIYREPLEGPRASGRPEGESFIIPPRPSARVMVDPYGREYIEPMLPPARQSVAPLPRSGEPEVIYERLPPRTFSGHPGAGSYDEGGVVYARPVPVYDPARRVYVSQADYPYDHGDGQYREHQLQQRGYVQFVRPHDARVVEERPTEYVSRGASLRPADRVRYETAQPYVRMHSARPEAPGGREYSGSVHADVHHQEGPQPYVREYGGSPVQRPPTVHREYSMRPPERYHDRDRDRDHESRGVTGGPDERTFIERPRAAERDIVYVDDVREVYQ
ncbi:hypothetical protein Trco_003738 [Trichoderma cornu-damae]|uniref:Uncharacterized protein n=1 Tax=Trichoderma cornu-damae TaxID=654480 RepID=A0A9P8QPU7_9HYPO|nr:hypothetical protein Trco_003738 [Trichoderma cornu-damae]